MRKSSGCFCYGFALIFSLYIYCRLEVVQCVLWFIVGAGGVDLRAFSISFSWASERTFTCASERTLNVRLREDFFVRLREDFYVLCIPPRTTTPENNKLNHI